MSKTPSISFSAEMPAENGVLVLFTNAAKTLGAQAAALNAEERLTKAMDAAEFKAGLAKSLSLVTPQGTDYDRIVLIGTGKKPLTEFDFLKLGGAAMTAVGAAKMATVLFDMPAPEEGGVATTVKNTSDFAQGMTLASYRFTKYKTSKKGDDEDQDPKDKDEKKAAAKITIVTPDAEAASSLWDAQRGVANGVMLARDLVNEPANVLTPKEFAKRAKKLEKLGCDVEILDEKDMKKLKMATLLGVSRGSRNPPRMAIIHWNGGKKGEQPVAFVGKGVTFDTGGISLKPAGGMEDMKGDMGGAAAVTGLMHALAARKAKANVIGVIALVENMPDGDAQRPGDIVTSMSGQTVEVLNTDAEGRLILADALWHTKEAFAPKFMVNLATLTGAILVALGNHHAGLFSNDDDLSEQITTAGLATQEKVWRMPLGPEYDKMIDSKNADMKNIGGRFAGSITAGQFLKRFVGDTPWAHLDVAGTAMGSPQNEISKSWASGFGVRLLDRLVADNYEG
ncbi:MAG: leucyl aminopeptidase [Pseudomonadota bacterium]